MKEIDVEVLAKAEAGNAKAQYEISEYYESKHDFENRFKWLEKSAAQGNIDSLYSLAVAYENTDEGVEKDLKKSLTYYLHCTEALSDDITDEEMYLIHISFEDVARFYEEGLGVDQSYETAFEWYLKAAKLQYAENAAFKVAQYYEKGLGVEQDYEKAAEWYASKYIAFWHYEESREALVRLYKTVLHDAVKLYKYETDLAWIARNKDRLPVVSCIIKEHAKELKDVCLDDYKEYYTKQFIIDFRSYYDICEYKLGDIWGVPATYNIYCLKYLQNERMCTIKNSTQYVLFVIAMFYTIMLAQVVGKVKNQKVMDDFSRASSWPQIICMAAHLSPVEMLRLSKLYPSYSEKDEFMRILDMVKDYHIADVVEFLQGGKPNANSLAYQRLVTAMCGTIEQYQKDCVEQVEFYKTWVRDPLLQTSFSIVNYVR